MSVRQAWREPRTGLACRLCVPSVRVGLLSAGTEPGPSARPSWEDCSVLGLGKGWVRGATGPAKREKAHRRRNVLPDKHRGGASCEKRRTRRELFHVMPPGPTAPTRSKAPSTGQTSHPGRAEGPGSAPADPRPNRTRQDSAPPASALEAAPPTGPDWVIRPTPSGGRARDPRLRMRHYTDTAKHIAAAAGTDTTA